MVKSNSYQSNWRQAIFPRKFYHSESSFGTGEDSFEIEWLEGELQVSGHPFNQYFCEGSINIKIPSNRWTTFETKVSAMRLTPIETGILDGTFVDCWITFRRQIIKFAMSNPDFSGFLKMRKLINDLTICSKLPKGIVEAMR